MKRRIKDYCTRETLAFAILGAFTLATALSFLTGTRSSAAGKPKMSTPIVSVGGSGANYIDLTVTGGAPTGAPAGFTIQWQTTGDYEQFGWPASSSCAPDPVGNPTCGESYCTASFSGNAASSNYSLAAGQSVTVRIGNLVLDNGVSTSCPGAELVCGHTYVFHAFAHANSTKQRSDYTQNVTGATTDCSTPCDSNVKDLTFWATHSAFCNLEEGCQEDAWPASIVEGGLTIGCNTYTAAELEAILLTTPSEGDCTTALLQQVIVANLNAANGANEDYVALNLETLVGADVLLCGGEGDCASLVLNLNATLLSFACPAGE